jgi:hypothetical protein
MQSLELTLTDGDPITVNAAAIACLQPANGGTLIVFYRWRQRPLSRKLTTPWPELFNRSGKRAADNEPLGEIGFGSW